MSSSAVHAHVHRAALALGVIALPWSEFLLSNALIILFVNWLWEGLGRGDLKARCIRALTTPASAIWLGSFGLHLLGLLWTQDLKWGMDLCRILLPVPILGLVLGSSPRLSAHQLRSLLTLGAWSVVASTLVCLLLRHEVLGRGGFRELSVFISHIRLALMVCFAVVVLLMHWPRTRWQRIAHLAAIGWSLFFLVLLKGITGWLVLPVLAAWGAWRWAGRYGVAGRIGWGVAVIAALGAAAGYVGHAVEEYSIQASEDLSRLEVATAGGEVYFHDRERPQRENGHYVWIHVADDELERGWRRRSEVPFLGKDAKGQLLKGTLVRYLASMGQRKDSLGVLALSDEDVARIEQGVHSVEEGRLDPITARLDQVLYELDAYSTTGDANGHSITMRAEFLRTGWAIAKANWLIGTGTGDTQRAFDEAYDRRGSTLQPRWRLRAHDQYLTWWISFGVLGLIVCLFTWCWPAYLSGAVRHPLFVAWAIIVALSFLTEDTLETQMGATFAALYYALFVLAAPITSRSAPAHAQERSA
jgi:O-antigen ligase